MNEKLYKLSTFSQRINVHPKTLILWDNKDILKAKRTKTNRRYYTESQALDYLGIQKDTIKRKSVIYCRVSSNNQKQDLQNQENYLLQHIKNNGIIIDDIYKDIGSGLNYNRKYFNKLLKEVENNLVQTIYITHKDRFIRFGFEWFNNFCKEHFCEIIILNNTEKDIHTELTEDLISIIRVFSCKLYGLRNYKRKTDIEKLVEDKLKDVKP